MATKSICSIQQPNSQGNRSGTIMAYVHIICATIGAGVFALPLEVYDSGWISFLLLAFLSVISYFSGILIIRCLYYKKGQRLNTYSEIGNAAFGSRGKMLIQITCYLNMLGIVWVYIILVSQNIQSIIVALFDREPEYKYCCLIVGFVIMLPYCLFKTLKEATILSTAGTVTMLIAILVTCVCSFIKILDATPNKERYKEVGFANFSSLPSALSVFSFAIIGCVIFPQVEQEMNNKSKWPTALFLSVVTIGAIYTLVSLSGVLGFGKDTKAPIYECIEYKVPKLLILITISLQLIFTAPVYMCPFALEVEQSIGIYKSACSKKTKFMLRVLFRATVVFSLTILSVLIKNYKFAIGLIGAISNGVLIYLIPSVCFLKLCGFKGHATSTYIQTSLLFTVGCFSTIIGVYGTVNDYMKKR